MTITILTVGSRSKQEYEFLVQSFVKRMPRHITVTIRYIKHADGEPQSSIQRESENLLKAIPKDNRVIVLDERGTQYSSPELSKVLFSRNDNRDICIIIGGAHGVSELLRSRADIVWSLGALVFPHQLVRIIVSEQIYRAHCIHIGHPYHHA